MNLILIIIGAVCLTWLLVIIALATIAWFSLRNWEDWSKNLTDDDLNKSKQL